jgi:hypothetical protein
LLSRAFDAMSFTGSAPKVNKNSTPTAPEPSLRSSYTGNSKRTIARRKQVFREAISTNTDVAPKFDSTVEAVKALKERLRQQKLKGSKKMSEEVYQRHLNTLQL